MLHIDLALVHEIDQTFDVVEASVLHDDDGILLVGVFRQDRVKVDAAGAQDDPVCLDRLLLTGQCDIAEAAPVQQVREHGLQITVMVLPPQTVLLLLQHLGGRFMAVLPARLCS